MPKPKPADPMELMTLKLPRNPMTKATGIYVNVNTKNHFIPYGKTVEIPRYVAEVVERSIASDDATAEKIAVLSGEAEQREREVELGLL